jgi:CRP-like cAMP-binding protein
VVRRLSVFSSLSAEELKVLGSLKGRSSDSGTFIETSSDVGGAWIIQSGWCARLAPGKNRTRPMTTLLLPGDGFGIGAAPWAGDTMTIKTLTPCVLLDASPLRQIIRLRAPGHARLIEVCQRAGWVEQLYALHQLARLSGLTARPRVAHFLMELFGRLDCVGLSRGTSFELPIQQTIIADLLGLSEIHLNRTLRQLKSEELISTSRGGVTILDATGLAEIAGFTANAFSMTSEDTRSS